MWVLYWFNTGNNISQFTFNFECYCSLHFECYCAHFISNATTDVFNSRKETDRKGKTIFKRKGQLNLFSNELMAKFKTIMIGMPADGTAISCRIVMAIGNGVMQSNNPILDNGGLLQPMED